MAFIYSTDASVAKTMYRIGKERKRSKVRTFVNFGWNAKTKKPNGYITICARLVTETCLADKAIMGYNKESNELVIIPSITQGNIDVLKILNCNTRYISGRKFLLAVGFNDSNMPLGRYEAIAEKDGMIYVYLDRRLPEDEQPIRNGEVIYGAE